MAPTRDNLKLLMATRSDLEALREVERLLVGEPQRAGVMVQLFLPGLLHPAGVWFASLVDCSCSCVAWWCALGLLRSSTRPPLAACAVYNYQHPTAPSLTCLRGLFVRTRYDGYHIRMINRLLEDDGQVKLLVQVR